MLVAFLSTAAIAMPSLASAMTGDEGSLNSAIQQIREGDEVPADSSQTQKKSAGAEKKPESRRNRGGLSATEVRSAIQFAEKHQPPLALLVKKLKGRDSEAYQRAITELHEDSLRLTRLQERQPKRFESEVEMWKVDSEIRLQLARWAVSGNERSERMVRQLLKRRLALRQDRLQTERARLEARLQQIEEQIQTAKNHSDEEIDREWSRLTRRLKPLNRQPPAKASKGRKATDEKKAREGDSAKPNKTEGDRTPTDSSELNPTGNGCTIAAHN